MPGTALWVDGFIWSPFVSLHLACMPGTALWENGFICLPLSPFICLPLSPSLDVWHGFPGGRVHLSPFVFHWSSVVSQPKFLPRGFSGWTDSLVSLCLPSFVSRCLSAWMPGSALWVDGFICLPLSRFWVDEFICLPLSPSLSSYHGAFLGGWIHLSPFVSLHLSPVVSQPGCLARLSGWTCLPGSFGFRLSADSFVFFVSHLFLVVSQPGCLCLCLPSGWTDCLPAPRREACQTSRLGRVHSSPIVSWPACLAQLSQQAPLLDGFISEPGCLARLSGRTGSFVSAGGCLARLLGWMGSFVSRCLPAWMPGTVLWVDGFICFPFSPFICPRLSRIHARCIPRAGMCV